jgi:hypothetical protein
MMWYRRQGIKVVSPTLPLCVNECLSKIASLEKSADPEVVDVVTLQIHSMRCLQTVGA